MSGRQLDAGRTRVELDTQQTEIPVVKRRVDGAWVVDDIDAC